MPLTRFASLSLIKGSGNALFPLLEHAFTDLLKLLMIVDIGAQ